jgi:hypothetical protein
MKGFLLSIGFLACIAGSHPAAANPFTQADVDHFNGLAAKLDDASASLSDTGQAGSEALSSCVVHEILQFENVRRIPQETARA